MHSLSHFSSFELVYQASSYNHILSGAHLSVFPSYFNFLLIFSFNLSFIGDHSLPENGLGGKIKKTKVIWPLIYISRFVVLENSVTIYDSQSIF